MRVVVTGARGQLGRSLALTCPPELDGDVVWADRSLLDVTDPAAVAASPVLAGVDVVLNCAAFTDVDAAEAEPGRTSAEAANATAPGLIARRCADEGARLVHVSTDYVFGDAVLDDAAHADAAGSRPVLDDAVPGGVAGSDGVAGSGAAVPAGARPLLPGDPTSPQTVYGRTKLAGERAALAACPQTTVVRTAWVYSGDTLPEHKDFVSTMLRLARGGVDPQVVDDQFGSPTFAPDLARALWRIVLEGGGAAAAAAADVVGVAHAGTDTDTARRVLHGVGAGWTSWYLLAREVFAAAGFDPDRVSPVDTAGYPTRAKRPRWSVLAPDLELPEWRTGVARAVAARL